MSTIPDIRDRLHELADEHKIDELHELAEATRRRYHGRRAPAKHGPLTDDEIDGIREYAKAHPDVAEAEIAARFQTNQGRVSEALFGKRV